MVPCTSFFKNVTVCVQKYYGYINKSRTSTRDFQNEAGKPIVALL